MEICALRVPICQRDYAKNTSPIILSSIFEISRAWEAVGGVGALLKGSLAVSGGESTFSFLNPNHILNSRPFGNQARISNL